MKRVRWRGVARSSLKPIRYSQRQRWTDAFQGWRDGRAGIPAKRSPAAPIGPATTPHREALIRLAQDAFGYEHLEYRRLVAEPHRRIMAERARLDAAQSALSWARSAYDMESGTLTEQDTRRRRLGEEHHPESVIVERRRKDHQKLRARAQVGVTRAQADIMAIEAILAQVIQEAEQHHQAVVIRVERIHEYIHRRLAVYRRALIRAHPDGAWANAALSVRAPEIPGWALPDAYLPDSVPPPSPPPEEEEPKPPADEPPPVRIIDLVHQVTRFGSDENVDPDGKIGYVTLSAPVAAPWHFTVIKKDDELLELRTRSYGHGPYMGGEAVREAVLEAGDFFDFADHRYTMRDASQLEEALLTKCDLVAAELFATSQSKVRLSSMSFVQREKTLLAVLGPSGAGKSSLFKALLGELPLESGRLFFQEMPMDTHAKQIRELIGFVPQDINLHQSLTVISTLRYGFGLRSPAGRKNRDAAVARALKVLKLGKQQNQLLSTLSGGQLRRVSIALELLTDPALLLLDEPTSGLDASMDREIMNFLRKHAEGGHPEGAQGDGDQPDSGHTVIVVTHATEHLSRAHQILAVVENGTPAYSGPPRQIRRHFRFSSYADLLDMLFNQAEKWARKYQAGQMPREAIREADKLDRKAAAQSAPSRPGQQRNRVRTPRAALLRFWVLIKRQCLLLGTRALTKNVPDRTTLHWLRNWGIVSLPLTVTIISAALAAVVASSPGLGAQWSGAGPTALSLITTLCVLSGQALTYSDVVNELEIIRREFRAGIGAFSVLATKWLVYAVIAISQAGLITVVFCLFPRRAPQRSVIYGPEVGLFISLAALSIAAMTLGLLLSTLASKLEHAVAMVTATSIAQIALNGITSDLGKFSAIPALASVLPDRWGLAAAASSIDLRGINQGHPTQVTADALWRHSSGQWSQDLAALGLLSALFFGLAVWRLHAVLRPRRPRRRGTFRKPAAGSVAQH